MWQQLIVALIVIAAAVYAARALGPRRWRRRANTSGATGAAGAAGAAGGAAGPCGCGKDDGGCH
jgi:hypothetical protein